MVSPGVCWCVKGRQLFVYEKAKVNADYYVGRLLPEVIADCNHLPVSFIFQQDGAQRTRHASRRTGCRPFVPGLLKRMSGPKAQTLLN